MTRPTALAASAVLLSAFAVLTALFAAFRPDVLSPQARADEFSSLDAAREDALLTHMMRYQRYLEKAALAVDAGNAPLAGFYAHEIEEVSERLVAGRHVDDGVDLSAIAVEAMLPRTERLGAAARSGDLAAMADALAGIVTACNACHRRSGHRWIVIERPLSAVDPYPSQSFAPVR